MLNDLMSIIMPNLTATMVGILLIIALSFWLWYIHDTIIWADFWARHWHIRKWRKQTAGIENASSWEKAGMPGAEESLCAYYFKHIKGVQRQDFDNALKYLAITHQSERKPMSFWMLLILFILTVAEAATTGAFIAPFVSQFATGNQITMISYGAAVVLAIMLLIMTHFAGTTFNKYASIRTHIGPYASSESGFYKEAITSGMDQDKDRAESSKIRYGNRILKGHHDRGSLLPTIVVGVILVVLLLAIFFGRVWQIHAEETKMVAVSPACAAASTGQTGSTDPFATLGSGTSPAIPGFPAGVTPPADLRCNADTSKKNAADQEGHDRELSGDAAALILAIIYLLTQLAGFFFSSSHSFIADGRKAYETTWGEPSYSAYETHYVTPGLNRAVGPLTELRNALAQRVEQYGRNPSNMTMQDYYERKLMENTARQNREPAATAPLPARGYTPPPVANDHADTVADFITDAAKRILAAADADEKERILVAASGNDTKLEAQIIDKAKALKAEAESRAASRRSRLEGL